MFNRSKSLTDLASSLTFEEKVKRIRIVVIDDVDTEFPFKVLEKQGYAIDYWEDVVDLQKLERGFYDIIILDIGGVGQDLDDESEGVGVLTHLKQVNPSQIVIAYSGQSHESKRIPFFRVADQYVPKPTNAISWKEILDDIIATRITVQVLWEAATTLLRNQGVTDKQLEHFEKRLIKAASQNEDASTVIRSTLGAVDKVTTLAGIVGKIILLCG